MPVLSRYAGELVARKRDTTLGAYRDAYEKTGVSIGTWDRIEKCKPFHTRSLWRVVDALGWDTKAVEQLLNDQDPDGPERSEPQDLFPAFYGEDVRQVVRANEDDRLSAVERRLDRIERLLAERLGAVEAP